MYNGKQCTQRAGTVASSKPCTVTQHTLKVNLHHATQLGLQIRYLAVFTITHVAFYLELTKLWGQEGCVTLQ